ncbi:MAG: hypothetical protein AAF798_03345 [Bacteroidota bacterium]
MRRNTFMNYLPVSLLLFLLSLSSCTDLKFEGEHQFPVVDFIGLERVDETGFVLTGEVLFKGNDPNLEAYANWYPVDASYFREQAAFLEPFELPSSGKFRVPVNRNVINGLRYDAGFVFRSGDQSIYLDSVATFETLGSSTAAIKLLDERPFTNSVIREAFLLNSFERTFYLLLRQGVAPDLFPVNSITGELGAPIDNARIFFFGFIIAASEEVIYASSKKSLFSSIDENGLWRITGDITQEPERIADFPILTNEMLFSTAAGEHAYIAKNDGQLVRFPLSNYQGLETLSDLPISIEAHTYYPVAIGNKIYVFFSTPGMAAGTDFHEHELWEYAIDTDSWTLISTTFPGSGRDEFIVNSDGQRYLYIGNGAIGTDQDNFFPRSVNGDIWRYDLMNNSWEFVGLLPTDAVNVRVLNPRAQNDKIYLMSRERDTQLFAIDPSLLPLE